DDLHVLGRNCAELRPCFGHRQLDFEPQLVLVLLRPDAAHRRARVARDHRAAAATSSPMSVRYCLPLNATCWAASYTAARSRPTSVSTRPPLVRACPSWSVRSEEHTSELQSLRHLVCR